MTPQIGNQMFLLQLELLSSLCSWYHQRAHGFVLTLSRTCCLQEGFLLHTLDNFFVLAQTISSLSIPVTSHKISDTDSLSLLNLCFAVGQMAPQSCWMYEEQTLTINLPLLILVVKIDSFLGLKRWLFRRCSNYVRMARPLWVFTLKNNSSRCIRGKESDKEEI